MKEGQLRDYEDRLGKPFEHEEYRSQLADLRDKLKLGLSEHAPEGGESVTQLAEKIKELRSSVRVEAVPDRVGTRKTVRAERPVTARIRERLAEVEPHARSGSVGQPKDGRSDANRQEMQVVEKSAGHPAAQIIPLPVAKPVEEKPEDGTPGTPPDGASRVAMPAMYQERGHARQVMKRRQAVGAQLRLF